MSKWRTVKLKDITTKIGSGSTPRGGESVYISEGTSLIRSQNIYNFEFKKEGLVYIDEQAANKLKNVTIEPQDILLNITGDSVGRCSIVPSDVLPARVNQHVCIIRADKGTSPHYLMYVLNEQQNKERLLNQVHGGTRKALTKGIIEEFEVSLPDYNTQKAVVSLLGNLDKKIQLNNKININLERMAQTLYKYWFVDQFTEEEIELSEVLNLNPRLTVKKGTLCSYIDMKALPTSASSIQYASVEKKAFSSGIKFQNDDVLLARITPCFQNGKAALVSCLEEGEIAFGSTEFLVLRPNEYSCSVFLYCLCKDPSFLEYAGGSMVGTSGRQRIQNDFLLKYRLSKPTQEKMDEFKLKTADWFKMIADNTLQNHILTETRDYLLPRLISGEITVKEVAKIVKEVLING